MSCWCGWLVAAAAAGAADVVIIGSLVRTITAAASELVTVTGGGVK